MDENEEEKEEATAEEIADAKAKAGRINKKMDAFMVEIASDLMGDKEMELAKKKIDTFLKMQEVPNTLSYVKAFKAGIMMCMNANNNGGDNFMMMSLVCANKYVDNLEKHMKTKVDKSMGGTK